MHLNWQKLEARRWVEFWAGPGSLLLGLGSLVAAVALTLVLRSQQQLPVLPTLVRQVNSQLHGLERQARAQNANILAYLAQREQAARTTNEGVKVQRGYLNSQAKLPAMVLLNGKLFHWTDPHMMPSLATLTEPFAEKLVWEPNKRYLLVKEVLRDSASQRWEVVSLITLFNRYPISNDYLPSGWQLDGFANLAGTLIKNSDAATHVTLQNGTYLFSVFQTTEQALSPPAAKTTLLLLFSLAIVCLSWWFCRWVLLVIVARRKVVLGLVLLIAWFGTLRLVMYWSGFPANFIDTPLFDNTVSYATLPSLSLGDLALNLLVAALLLGYVFNYLFTSTAYDKLRHRPRWIRLIQSLVLVAVGYATQEALLLGSKLLFSNATWTLDLNQTLALTPLRLLALVVFLLFVTNFFLFSHVLVRLFLKINGNDRVTIAGSVLLGTIGYLALAWLYRPIFHWHTVALMLGYHYFVIIFRLAKYVGEQRYQTFIYYFLCAAIAAATAALAHRELVRETVLQAKRDFANQLLSDTDAIAEQLLDRTRAKIQRDDFVRNRMVDPLSNKALVVQKITRAHLDPYFNKYDISVRLFNTVGTALEELNAQEAEYFTLLRSYTRNPAAITPYSQLFFSNELNRNVFKRYICFVPLEQDSIPIGYVLLDLRLKRIPQSNVYPQLLVDRSQGAALQNRTYSYAIFSKEELIYAFGNFDYERSLDRRLLDNAEFKSTGLDVNGLHHLGVDGPENRTVVVSSVLFPFSALLNSFSTLFFVLICYILVLVLGYLIYLRYQNTQMLLATKIQLFLNAAFLLPLLLVSGLTLSSISRSYVDDLYASFINRTDDVALHLAPDVQQFLEGSLAFNTLAERIGELSRHTGQDINVFGTNGLLISSSQPSIYEKGLLSPYVNPVAWALLTENRQANTLQSEFVGKLAFKTAYVPIYHNASNKLLAMVAVPYFDSGQELNHQITEVVFSLLRIFTTIFLLFIALGYYVSQQLVVPLKIITQRLRRTNLQSNTRLEWKTKDEIGLLISEYNRMLLKLEASKEALSRNEKESAWREMAQQVAHEIKNPLTPMKLTLQYLQKAMENNHPNLLALLDRSINTLLTQVENLSDIATSFSAFAKMPTPKMELMDVAQVLRATCDLYRGDGEHDLEVHIPDDEVWIQADARLMSRIFTNLILNALQAVAPGTRPQLKVTLELTPQRTVLISIEDNGEGIPEELGNKVFMPNFSTKSGGTGIGLAVAKRGINHAGGNIWFKSIPGEGTTFYVEMVVE